MMKLLPTLRLNVTIPLHEKLDRTTPSSILKACGKNIGKIINPTRGIRYRYTTSSHVFTTPII